MPLTLTRVSRTANLPVESSTRNRNVYVPGAVGTPASTADGGVTPAGKFEPVRSDSPGGNAPLTNDQVWVPVPPLGVNWFEKPRPTERSVITAPGAPRLNGETPGEALIVKPRVTRRLSEPLEELTVKL